MKRTIKLLVLYSCKFLGLFFIARRMTRGGLRILCYHGMAYDNEYELKPKLFMRLETFRHRMALLRKHGFPLLPLREALSALDAGTLPDCATVVTFDDGWRSIYRDALPILRELNIPATVYVTTYYVEKGIPDIHALLEYAVGNSSESRLYLGAYPEEIRGPWGLSDERARACALSALIGYTDACAASVRPVVARAVVDGLGLDWERLERTRVFYLMDTTEMRALNAAGVDIQLHTHRHRLPFDDKSEVEREIEENRRALLPFARGPLDHLAYPKGEYDPCQFEWLESIGIKSATTCRPGLNYADTPRLELNRFLDGENVSDIEFEAEMTGMATLLRNLARVLSQRGGRIAAPTSAPFVDSMGVVGNSARRQRQKSKSTAVHNF